MSTGEFVQADSVSLDPAARPQPVKIRNRLTLACGCSWWKDGDARCQPFATGVLLMYYALLRARQHARTNTVAVWRNHSFDSRMPALENVTSE
jgi:hypothetical protein